MMQKIKDRNDILLLGTMGEVSCFTERLPFSVQFGWELHKGIRDDLCFSDSLHWINLILLSRLPYFEQIYSGAENSSIGFY